MNAEPLTLLDTPPRVSHPTFEVRFWSLFQPGRALSFPCDDQGRVDLDALSETARNNYLFARATVGREHGSPQICIA